MGFNLNVYEISGQAYIIMGASAMLASYTRMSYSLAVIMLETTQSINLFLPIVFSIMIALGVARACNRSLYEYSLRSKQVPLLRNHLPKENNHVRVKDMIGINSLEVVESVCTVSRIAEVLQQPFHCLPVVNTSGKLIGIIPKNFLIVLIENHAWYENEHTAEGVPVTNAYQTSVARALSVTSLDIEAGRPMP